MGGTRFVGKALVTSLKRKGHDLTLFTRGRNQVPEDVEHIKGDRFSSSDLETLKGRNFDVIVDTSGRKQSDTESVLATTGSPKYRFLYMGSAGVYSDSEIWPLTEESPLDASSRHLGKADTERWLLKQKFPFTSFRPTYIYGPGNYNPIEKWFFDRIVNNKPIPIPDDGSLITQLGHVSDLAEAMALSLETSKSQNQIYNCSAKQGVTFLGLVQTAANVCGTPIQDLSIRSFDSRNLDSKARKAFPIRINHFLTDISKIQNDLDWTPEYDLGQGLSDSFSNDYCLNDSSQPDFSNDEILI